jgi:hypothetical protein
MSLVLAGNEFIVVTFLLMALNGVFCFAKVPILAIPLGIFTWIIFFATLLSLDVADFILIMVTMLFASGSIALNVKDMRK